MGRFEWGSRTRVATKSGPNKRGGDLGSLTNGLWPDSVRLRWSDLHRTQLATKALSSPLIVYCSCMFALTNRRAVEETRFRDTSGQWVMWMSLHFRLVSPTHQVIRSRASSVAWKRQWKRLKNATVCNFFCLLVWTKWSKATLGLPRNAHPSWQAPI